MDRWMPPKRFFQILFILFLPVWGALAYNVVRQIRRHDELEKLIPERIAKHNTWAAVRRAEVKALEEKAANAGDDVRDRLTEEAERAREALDAAITTDRAEIMKLWDEARNSRSTMPRPAFDE